MKASTREGILGIIASVVVGAVIAWAGGSGGIERFGWPVFWWCGMLAFGINWLVFVHAWLAQTEHYFDLTGSLTYLVVTSVGLLSTGASAPRAWLLAALVSVWALRLGSFLFIRVKRQGKDGRFDNLKPDFVRFLMTWTIQGLWVLLTVGCALAAITSAEPGGLDVFAIGGFALWLLGFGIEAVADRQKTLFRRDPANRGRFITSGLWAWSRHPNYCGEIVLWAGVAVIALPALQGWQHATLVSPIFVYGLLTRMSGVPLLERRADRTWGGQPEYEAYKASTPVLWPRPPAQSRSART